MEHNNFGCSFTNLNVTHSVDFIEFCRRVKFYVINIIVPCIILSVLVLVTFCIPLEVSTVLRMRPPLTNQFVCCAFEFLTELINSHQDVVTKNLTLCVSLMKRDAVISKLPELMWKTTDNRQQGSPFQQ